MAPKPVFKALFVALAALSLHIAISSARRMRAAGAFRSAGLRFTALGTRGPGPANRSSISALGLLRGGCPVAAGPAVEEDVAGGTRTVLFGRSLPADGYFFATGDGPPDADPVLWTVESLDDGGSWRQVGLLVEYWSNAGRMLVECWSNTGRMLVEYWSNADRMLVECWSNAGRMLAKY